MVEYYLLQKHMNIGADSCIMRTFFALKMIGLEGSFLSCPPRETKSRNTQDYKYSPLRGWSQAHKILISIKETCRLRNLNFHDYLEEHLSNLTSKF